MRMKTFPLRFIISIWEMLHKESTRPHQWLGLNVYRFYPTSQGFNLNLFYLWSLFYRRCVKRIIGNLKGNSLYYALILYCFSTLLRVNQWLWMLVILLNKVPIVLMKKIIIRSLKHQMSNQECSIQVLINNRININSKLLKEALPPLKIRKMAIFNSSKSVIK